jgi:hypothetical protein
VKSSSEQEHDPHDDDRRRRNGRAANARAKVIVNANITTSTTWVATDTYNLQGTIYVMPGVTLTIDPGTVIASEGPGGTAGGNARRHARRADLRRTELKRTP